MRIRGLGGLVTKGDVDFHAVARDCGIGEDGTRFAFEVAHVAGVARGDVGEEELVRAGTRREVGGLACGGVARFVGSLGLVIAESRFVHKDIRILRRGESRGTGAGIPREDDPAPGAGGADERVRLDRASVGESDRLAAVDVSPEGALGDPEVARELRIEAAAPFFFHQRVA